MNTVRRDAFQAIADPNRRAIIDLLAKKELTLSQVADNFKISRPAVSKHVKLLQESGIVEVRQEGRERYCRVRLEMLSEVSSWIEQYQVFWQGALDRLGGYLKKMK